MPLPGQAGEVNAALKLIHREIVQLCILILVAIAAFSLTRGVAANNRDMNRRDAAEWYRRGQEAIAAGSFPAAVDSFRRATVRDRGDRRYILALARSLALSREDDAAHRVLLTLRESAPEDPDVNLQLARLAAARRDVTEAVRFYHNALYAPWPADRADVRRNVRIELIRFLLASGQETRALPELLALSADLPDDVVVRLEVAQLFSTAGDNAHALDQYQRVLRLAPDNGEALAGAGQAAFHLGDYQLARTYLRRAPAVSEAATNTRDIVDLVLSSDPLANRLGSAERRRRLVSDFSYAQERLDACLAQRAGGQPANDELALVEEARDFGDELKPAVLEHDTIETGVDLIDRIGRLVARNCGPPTALDQALVLIGRQHGAGAP